MHTLSFPEIAVHFLAACAGGGCGCFLTRKVTPPRPLWAWLLLLAATWLAGEVGTSTRLVSVFDITVYLNDILQGVGFGFILGFARQAIRYHPQ